MTIQPHKTACLRCVFEEAPPVPARQPAIRRRHHADHQRRGGGSGGRSIELLTGQETACNRSLMQFDVWRNEWRKINPGRRRKDVLLCRWGA